MKIVLQLILFFNVIILILKVLAWIFADRHFSHFKHKKENRNSNVRYYIGFFFFFSFLKSLFKLLGWIHNHFEYLRKINIPKECPYKISWVYIRYTLSFLITTAVCRLKYNLYLGYDFAINYQIGKKIKSCIINSLLEINVILFFFSIILSHKQ